MTLPLFIPLLLSPDEFDDDEPILVVDEGSSSLSSCDSIGYNERGRHGISVQQNQQGTNFPLVDPSTSIRYLLADAYLEYENPRDYNPAAVSFELPFKIVYLYGLGCLVSSKPDEVNDPTHDVDIVITDNNDAVVFDSTLATTFESKYWGSRFKIFEWRADNGLCRIVVHTKWRENEEITPRHYRLHITPASAVLDERVPYQLPKRVRSLSVLTDQFTATGVDIVAGYNMAFTLGQATTSKGRRRSQQVEVAATPGSGLGLFPGCVTETDLLIRTVNGVAPTDAGDFRLEVHDCYWLRQPTEIISTSPRIAEITPATLTLGNSCAPCCDCDDFVSAAYRLNTLASKYHRVGYDAERARDVLSDNINRWNTARSCIEATSLRLAMVAGTCPFVEIAGQFCNHSDLCVGPVLLNFHVDVVVPDANGSSLSSLSSGAPETPNITCRSGIITHSVPPARDKRGKIISNPNKQEKYSLLGKFPDFQAFWWAVDPADAVSVRFQLQFSDRCTPYQVIVKLTGCVGYAAYDPLFRGVDFDEDGNPSCGYGGPNIDDSDQRVVTLDCPDPCNPAPECDLSSSSSSLSEGA